MNSIQVVPRLILIEHGLLLFSLLHPILIEHRIEHPLHLLLKLLVDRPIAYLELYLLEYLIDESHDEVIVLSVLPELEGDGRVEEVVVEWLIGVIDFPDGVVDIPVDLLRLRDGVFGHLIF